MPDHQASEQMLGYLYQVRYALYLLLRNREPECQMSIEKFDDVAFSNDDTPIQLIQLKHHVQHQGSLTDASTDLWRTLKVWLDIVTKSPDILNETSFLIITTAAAPADSAASLLKDDKNRDPDAAYKKLKSVCTASMNKAHEGYYASFLTSDENTVKRLIDKIYIIDCADNIVDIEKDILQQIRYNCRPEHEKMVYERLEGWWFKKAIEALCSNTPVFVDQNQVRAFIVDVGHEYAFDNLPIDEQLGNLQGITFSDSEKVLGEQLALISLGERLRQIALRDYYRAFRQRASWIRNNLLYITELEKYEQKLIDEWEHDFAEMEDNLSEENNVTENEKVREGKKLFSNTQHKNILIRQKCQEPFIMRGSYHMLANQLKVGWHIDFSERLKQLRKT